MPRATRAAAVAALPLMLLAACSGGSGDVPADPSTTSTTVTDRPDPAEEAAGVWSEVWEANGRDVEDRATSEALEGIAAALVLPGEAKRNVESYPDAEATGEDEVVVNDCLLVLPAVTEAVGQRYSGVVNKHDDGQWQVTEVASESLSGCVPDELATGAFQGYEDYWDARLEFWDPPKPDSPLIEETMTGEQLALVQQLVREDAEAGRATRGRPETHPEVHEVRSPTEVVISDCQVQPTSRGVFDVETGRRLDDLMPPVEEGQRDIVSAVMRLEDGKWKVARVDGQEDVECEFAPTERGLPQV